MNEQIQKSLDRLKESISELERLDSSYWNASLGTSHLSAYAEQITNDAKTLAAHLKSIWKEMSRYNFDCHYNNGYTGCCDLKGGECHKICKDFITEDDWLAGYSESDIRISVAKLREILITLAEKDTITNTQAIMIINQVKKSI